MRAAATRFSRARLGIAQSGFFVIGESEVRGELRKVSNHLSAKETQIRFKMQKDGEPVWDQTVIDRLKILAAAGSSWRGKAQSSRTLR